MRSRSSTRCSGTTGKLATTQDLYDRKAVLIIGADLAIEHPFLSFQIRANLRHHEAHVYVVTPGPVREDQYAAKSVRKPPGSELDALAELRDALAAEPELVILFGDSVKGDDVRKLVAFGDSLGNSGQVLPAGRLFEFARRDRHGPAAGTAPRLSGFRNRPA